MISKELMEILACPESKSPLRGADSGLLAGLNERIAKGDVQNRDGAAVTEPVEEGLVREDGKILYPVRAGVPMLRIGDGISLDEAEA